MIETERLQIRRFQDTDAADLFDYLSLPETYVFEPGEPITLQEAHELAIERSATDDFLAVVQKNDKKMIGHLYFKQVPPDQFMTWELGYIFNPSHQRQGYGSEASAAIVRYSFAHSGTHRITANCNVENIASWKLLERIGMRREAHYLKKGFFRRDGNEKPIWFDAYHYAMLSSDL